jgi:hypothetical protein
MAATTLKAEGFATMTLAVAGMETAIDDATEAIDATTQTGIEKIGSGNWGYWVVYS